MQGSCTAADNGGEGHACRLERVAVPVLRVDVGGGGDGKTAVQAVSASAVTMVIDRKGYSSRI